MKKYLPLILLALVSCKGFLEEVPTTSLSEKDVYDSPQALEANINGCYLTIQIETRNFEHIEEIRAKLMEKGFKLV